MNASAVARIRARTGTEESLIEFWVDTPRFATRTRSRGTAPSSPVAPSQRLGALLAVLLIRPAAESHHAPRVVPVESEPVAT